MIRNAPLLHDGTPMPTRYWLVDPELSRRVSRLESGGGVRAAEAVVDAGELEAAHVAYASERERGDSRPTTPAPDRAAASAERARE